MIKFLKSRIVIANNIATMHQVKRALYLDTGIMIAAVVFAIVSAFFHLPYVALVWVLISAIEGFCVGAGMSAVTLRQYEERQHTCKTVENV